MYSLPPSAPFYRMIGEILCNDSSSTQELCVDALFTLVGKDYDQINRTILPNFLEYLPAGGSFNQLTHYLQLIASNRFQLYNYNNKTKNIQKYGKSIPPDYNLANVAAPMTLYYGTMDALSVPRDTLRFVKKTKKYIYKLHRLEGWNHIDFMFAIDADKVLFKSLIVEMKLSDAGNGYIDTIQSMVQSNSLSSSEETLI